MMAIFQCYDFLKMGQPQPLIIYFRRIIQKIILMVSRILTLIIGIVGHHQCPYLDLKLEC